MRIAVVTVVPAPYRAPLYEEIDRLLRERGGRLTVVYSGRRRPGLQWPDNTAPTGRVRSIFLNDEPPVLRGRALHANPLVVRALRQAVPDVVVLGGYAPWIYPAAAWCRLARVPYLIWSGETVASARHQGDRRRIRRPLWRGASGFLAYGPDAAAYLRFAGLPKRDIAMLGNGIDIDSFAARVANSRERRDEIRRRYNLAGHVVLSVGGKNLELVEAAAERLPNDVTVAVAGRTAAVGRRVRSLGKLLTQTMPDFYAAGDCLAHPPAFDQWPHAINEALAGGVPVVASREVGVPHEVLTGPGCAVVRLDAEELALALDRALEVSAAAGAEVREAVRAPLRPWGVHQMAERIVGAAERVQRRRPVGLSHPPIPDVRARA